jgi:tripartite-type tricarboxylate transporter receptor subunit TctC
MRFNESRSHASSSPEPAEASGHRVQLTGPLATVLLLLLCLGTAHVQADEASMYPRRSVTIIVPYAAGGAGDTLTRAIAMHAQQRLGRRVLVENRPGGGGTIGVGAVARASPDGYTLGFVSSSPIVSVPNFVRVPYDPERDFIYIARFMISAYPVLVRTDSPWQSFEELLAFARANPRRLRWSTAGLNGSPHIAVEAALRQEGVRAAFVPMQGSPEVLAGLLGDTLDVGVISDYAPLVAAGRLRVLAEIGAEVFPGLDDVPTFKALNYPLAPSIFFGLAGPAGMPAELVELWSGIVRDASRSAEFASLIRRMNGSASYLDHRRFHHLVLEDISSTRRALSSLNFSR